MIIEGFIKYASINKKRYSFIKKLMVFDKSYELFVRSSYTGSYGLRGLNNSYKQLLKIFNNKITRNTNHAFIKSRQSRNSVSQQGLQQSRGKKSEKVREICTDNSFGHGSILQTGIRIDSSSDISREVFLCSSSFTEGIIETSRECGPDDKREIFLKSIIGSGESPDEIIKRLEESVSARNRKLEDLNREIEQGKRDVEQGKRDVEQGKRDVEQGKRDVEQGKRDVEQGKRDVEQGKRDVEQGKRDVEEIEFKRQAQCAAADREIAAYRATWYLESMRGIRRILYDGPDLEFSLEIGLELEKVAEFYRYLSNKPRKKWGKMDTHGWNIITDWYARNRVEKIKLQMPVAMDDSAITIDV